MAIAAVLFVVVVSVNQSRGRTEFDNNMKAVLSKLKNLQNQAYSGVGPDPASECTVDSPTNSINSDGLPKCPPTSAIIIPGESGPRTPTLEGRVIVFGTPESTKLPNDGGDFARKVTFPNIATPVNKLSNKYYSYRAALIYAEPPPPPLPTVTLQSEAYGAVDKLSLPAGVGYYGACIVNFDSPPAATDTCGDLKQAISIMVGKIPNNAAFGPGANGSIIVNITDATRGGYGSHYPIRSDSTSLPFFGGGPAYTPVQKLIKLNFKDLSGKYQAVITLNTQNNQISLELK